MHLLDAVLPTKSLVPTLKDSLRGLGHKRLSWNESVALTHDEMAMEWLSFDSRRERC